MILIDSMIIDKLIATDYWPLLRSLFLYIILQDLLHSREVMKHAEYTLSFVSHLATLDAYFQIFKVI